MAIGAESVFARTPTKNIVEIPLHITRNDQVKPSVVVVVHPGGTGHPTRAGNARRGGHVRESTVTIVVVKRTASVSGYVEVFESVVVVVANRNARGIAESRKARLLRHIFEGSIGFLMIEPVPVLRAVFPGNRAFRCRVIEPRAISEKDI